MQEKEFAKQQSEKFLDTEAIDIAEHILHFYDKLYA